MGIEVDSLEIPLKTHSQTAIRSIDTLIDRLGVLNTSLTKINGSGLTGVANGVNKLSSAMQGMKSVGTADFTRLANNITKIASLDSKSINRAASAIGQISKSLGSLKSVSVSGTSKQVAELANGIAKLGYKSSTKAIGNIPKLATAMNQLMTSLSKAPKVSQNLINMTNALANLARTGASSGKAATSLSRSLDTYTKSTSKASSGTKGLASALGKTYASYWLLFRAFQKIGQSITLASDLVEVQNVVNTVFGDMTAKVEQYADKSIKQFGMSELAFKQYASRFQAMGTAMGIDTSSIENANKFLNKSTGGYVALSDSMADVSLTLTQLTADMASFYNVEQAAVAEDLAAIFTGETRPLRTYGLDLTQATLSEWAMKQGLDANIQSMSQAEKTMLRYQYVLANTTAAQGDFARTANTWANQVRILQEQIKKWASVIGTGVIAAFKPFLQTLNTVMARVIDFTENVLNALGNIFGWKFEISGGGITDDLADSMGDTAIDTGNAAGSAGDLSDNLGDAAKNAKKLYSTVLGIDELNINNPNTGNAGSGSGGSGGTGGSGSGGAGTGSTGSGLTTNMTRNDAILKAYESSIDSLYELGEYIGNTLTKTLNSINWDSVYQGARNFGKGLADFLNGLISPELFGAVGRTIAGALNTAIYAALSFGENFDFYDFGVSIATGINEFFRTFDFGALAQTLNVWVNGIEEAIIAALSHINWGNIFKSIYDFISNLEFDTAILVGWYALPKLFKSITSNKFVKGFTTLSKALAGNQTALLSLTQSYPKLSKAVNVARKAFQNFQFGVINGNIMTGLNEGILTVRNSLTKMQKGVIGAISVFAEFSLVKDAFYDIAYGSDNLVISLGKIAVGAGAAAAALKLMGLSNPFTAVITGATALLAAIIGVNSAMTEQKQIAEEQEQMKIYGDTLDNITEKMHQQSEALRTRMEESQKYVETAGLAETQMASDLADRYFDLAEKEGLSNTEKDEMHRLAQTLVEQLPELENYYNTQTGLLDTTREAVDKLIEKRLEEIQMSAYEDKLKEAYQNRIDAVDALVEATELAKTAQENLNNAEENEESLSTMLKKRGEYDLLKQKIQNAEDGVDSLSQKEKDLWESLNSEGVGEYPSFYSLSEQVANAREGVSGLEEDYEKTKESFSEAWVDYNSVESQISELTSLISSGYKTAGNEAGEGYAEGLGGQSQAIAMASALAIETGVGAAKKAQNSNSPSKVYMGLGQDAISGYMLGFKIGMPVLTTYISTTAISIANSFGNSITKTLKKVARNIPSYFSKSWSGISAAFAVAPTFFSATFTSAYKMVTNAFQLMPSWFSDKWLSTKNIFRDATTYFRAEFQNAYNSIKNIFSRMDVIFHNEWDQTKAVFKDVQSFFKSGFTSAYRAITSAFSGLSSFLRNAFTSAYRAITSAFSGLSSFFRGVANDIIDPIGDAINGVIKGVNWILDELGSSKNLKSWSVPKFASGSSGVPKDTVGVVNDQPGSTYRELIVPPSGNAFIPTGRNVMLPLEKGTKIMPAGQTKSLLNGIPHFKKGIGRFFGNAWASAISYTGDAMDYSDNPEKLVQIAFDKFIDTSRWTGAIGNVGSGVINTIFDSAVNFIKKIFGSSRIEQAARWAIGIANDNSHGYDQTHRTGPDYDCSSLMTIALKKAGFNVELGTTFTMLRQLLAAGFKNVTSSVNLGSGKGMKRGDVLLNPRKHTAMYAGNGKIVHARINEFGGTSGGKTGDQTGDEIAVTPYHNHPWTYVLRYAKAYKNGIGRINLSDLIPAYEVGGFPEDGLFFANHNELVGQFDNGRTVVANNTNIQSGIKEGVKEAVAEILAPYLQQIADNTRETADKDFSFDVDGRSLVSAYDRRKNRNGFSFT